MSLWSVPREWAGETVVVMASGESFTQAQADIIRASGKRSIAVNTTFRRAPFADFLYAADQEWWRHPDNADAFSFSGRRVSVTKINDKVLWLKNSGREGLDENPSCLRTGSNGGYQALHLAYHLGARRVLLCGFDMHGGHWHGRHPHGLRETQPEHYEIFISRFATIAEPLRVRGVDVVNCNPKSSLRCFRFGNLEEELCREP